MPKSQYEVIFARQLKEAGLEFEREYRFHPERKWRLDFANRAKMVGFELEGGIWARGRHVRGSGFIRDCEKYAEATLLGWRVYRIPVQWIAAKHGRSWVERDQALRLAQRAMEALTDG